MTPKPWQTSILIHIALAGSLLLIWKARDLVPESLPIDIIEIKNATLGEKSKAAPQPLQKPPPKNVAPPSSNAPSTNPAANSTQTSSTNTASTSGTGTASEEYEVSEMPVLVNEVRIPYPPGAKSKGIQGVVLIDLIIDSEGRVRKADLINGPADDLNDAALKAVQNFKFKPAQKDDKAVAVKIRYAYRFILE